MACTSSCGVGSCAAVATTDGCSTDADPGFSLPTLGCWRGGGSFLATVHQPLNHNSALSVLADRLGALDAQLQEELAYCGVLTVRLDVEAELWLGCDQRSRPSRSERSLKVLVVMEPPEVQQAVGLEGFDLVLTWHADHLRQLPSARLFVPATPWLVPEEWQALLGREKRSGLGFLRGMKTKTVGHRLRHAIWDAREELAAGMQVPMDFIPGGVGRDERNRQFTYEFVLVVENSRHENYFTEKLLDAMVCRCIPVYWGCPNLGDFFDTAGVVEVGDGGLREVTEACQRLEQGDPPGGQRRAEALERNLELAKGYAGDFGFRLQRALEVRLPELRQRGGGRPQGGDDAERLAQGPGPPPPLVLMPPA